VRKAILILLAFLLTACRGTAGPSPRVAVILSGNSRLDRLSGLQDGLSDLGYAEGVNVILEIHNADNDEELLPQLVEEVVAGQPDLIVALGGIEADLLRSATDGSDLPVVFAGASDPVERGLVAGMEHSGNNLTGIDSYRLGLLPKQLGMLTRLVPDARRVLVYYLPNVSISSRGAPIAEQAGRDLGLDVQTIPLQTIEELGPLVARLQTGDADAIFLGPGSPILDVLEDVLAPTAMQAGIPILSPYGDLMSPGVLAAHGPVAYGIGRQGARLVDKILCGTLPGDIPIELPATLELVINLDTAEQLGLTIPDDVLALATEVISSDGRE
jgi:putative tryptophan/tyrosine transport system substrate-binding protein